MRILSNTKGIIAICIAVFGLSILPLLSCTEKSEVLKIGVIAPLTGDNASYGTALKHGLDLAFQLHEKNGDSDSQRIEIVYEDSQGDPQTGLAAFKKLTSVDRVPIVLGAMFSSVTQAIAPLAERQKIVLLSPTSSAVELTNAGDYIFRIYPSDSYDGQYLGEFAMQTLGVKSVAILKIQVSSVEAISQVFSQTVEMAGGKIVNVQSYSEGDLDFRTHLMNIRSSMPDLLFLPGYLQEMAIQLRQMRELDINIPILSISTFYDTKILDLAKNAAEGVMFSVPHFDISGNDSVTNHFVESYKRTYGSDPNIWAAYGFDVFNIAELAIKESVINGKVESQTIKDELYKISGFPGVTGTTSFDSNGDVQKQLRVLQVKNGEFIGYNSQNE